MAAPLVTKTTAACAAGVQKNTPEVTANHVRYDVTKFIIFANAYITKRTEIADLNCGVKTILCTLLAVNPCSDYACSPNARCVLNADLEPVCACAHSRWIDQRCDTEVCGDDSQCQHGGTCVR